MKDSQPRDAVCAWGLVRGRLRGVGETTLDRGYRFGG